MKSSSLLFAAALSVLSFSSGAWAQDANGCHDPAMFPNRIPNYLIATCKTANGSESFRWPGGQEQVLGVVTEVAYKVANPAQGATPKYVAANYANAITSIGGRLLEDPAKTTLGDRMVARVDVDGKDVWVKLLSETAVVGGNFTSYKLVIVQQDSASQVVTARKMLDELQGAGFVTLYINFDTGKWDLKPDSQTTIREIVSLLNGSPELHIVIEGHTDNVGTPEANKALSANRAKSVLEALIVDGIASDRLESAGYGQERPIADNRTEEGRAKNRRVELVKR